MTPRTIINIPLETQRRTMSSMSFVRVQYRALWEYLFQAVVNKRNETSEGLVDERKRPAYQERGVLGSFNHDGAYAVRLMASSSKCDVSCESGAKRSEVPQLTSLLQVYMRWIFGG